MVTRPSSSSRISSYSARADRLAGAALDLPAQLLGVQDGPGVDGLHGAQDGHLAGLRVDGHPERVHVERDGARRAVVVPWPVSPGTARAISVSGTAAGRVGRQALVPGPRLVARVVAQRRRRGDDLAAQLERGPVQREAGDDDARRPERARVVAGDVGVGLPDADPVDRRARAPARRAARARSSCRCRTRRCRRSPRSGRRRAAGPSPRRSARAGRWSRSSRAPCPSPTRVPSGAGRSSARSASAPSRGRGTGRGRSALMPRSPSSSASVTSRRSPGTTTLRRRSSNGSMPS